jgi:hypothetical protein
MQSVCLLSWFGAKAQEEEGRRTDSHRSGLRDFAGMNFGLPKQGRRNNRNRLIGERRKAINGESDKKHGIFVALAVYCFSSLHPNTQKIAAL